MDHGPPNLNLVDAVGFGEIHLEKFSCWEGKTQEEKNQLCIQNWKTYLEMESVLTHSTCQNFGTDRMDLINMVKEPDAWPNFSTDLETIKMLNTRFQEFKISHIPRW